VESSRRHTVGSRRTEALSGDAIDSGSAVCPVCATPSTTMARFCENCGHDFHGRATGGTGVAWVLVVEADAAIYERLRPDGVAFPVDRPPAVIAVKEDEILIGRSSAARDCRPDVDLSGPLADPAVSHRHLRLRRRVDGTYEVIDLGSTNGTRVNESSCPLEPGCPVELAEGDRVQIGAWTMLTLKREG
jgi:FHA domain